MENIKEKFEFEVSSEYEGMRLDKYLSEQIEEATRSYLEKLIDNNFVKVNSKVITKNGRKLKLGEKIEVLIPEEENIDVEPENIPLDIIYENDDFMIINKNYGMVVHPAYGNYTGTLVNALLYYTNNLSSINGNIRPGIIHRLDKDTSGLLVIAKKNDVHQKLAQQIAENKMNREYIAIVDGHFAHETGVIDAPLSRHQTNRLKRVVEKGGKHAVTHFEVLDSFADYSLVSCRLETGRTHQIRAHMEFIKHPIVNDPLYHPKGKNASEFGQYLHARTLSFTHPVSGEVLNFQVELPKQFDDFIRVNKGSLAD